MKPSIIAMRRRAIIDHILLLTERYPEDARAEAVMALQARLEMLDRLSEEAAE